MVEKLAKEFEKIRTSLNKSKKFILADIDKIEEKYRKLADAEKKSLMDSLSVLNDQLKYYDAMLGNQDNAVVDESDSEAEEFTDNDNLPSADEAVVDTVYPENNAQEEADDVFEQVDEVSAEEGFKEITEATWEEAFGENMDSEDSSESEAEPKTDDAVEEAAAESDTSDISEEWPMPEEWK